MELKVTDLEAKMKEKDDELEKAKNSGYTKIVLKNAIKFNSRESKILSPKPQEPKDIFDF